MWSRIVEAMLACWLAISPFVFAFGDDDTLLWINALAGAALVLTEFYAERGRSVDPHPLPGQRSRGE